MTCENNAPPGHSELADTVRVTILIASLGRASLLETLASIEAARVPTNCAVNIVIVDDSADGAVPRLLTGVRSRHPLRIVPLGARNVATARNALLDAATGDWGLFVDDDERVDREWLAAHLRAARDFDADVVFAPVYFDYPPEVPEWFSKANLLWDDREWSEDGRRVDTGPSGNTLVRLAAVRDAGIRFRAEFGRAGGEDTDFFERLGASGSIMVMSNLPKAWERVTASRATVSYVLERSARTGQTFARRRLAGAAGAERVRFAAGAIAKLVISTTAALLALPFGPARRYRFQAMAWSNLGKLREVLGASDMDGWINDVPAPMRSGDARESR